MRPTEPSVIPPELKVSPPRRPHLARGGYIMILGAAAFLAFILFLSSGGWMDAIQEIPNRAALQNGSSETTGSFLKWKQRKSSTALYSFSVDGKTYTGQARVPPQFLYSIGHSDSVTIRYLPAKPSINHPADWEWSPIMDWEAILFLPIMVFPAYMLITLRLERTLLTAGTPTVAVVSKCSTSGRGVTSLKYEFCTQDGTLINGNSESETRQEVGSLIPVLYMPQKPGRNLPYPPSFHRLPDA